MGKKVNFVKDAINKHFESAEELKDFMEEYVTKCDADFEYLCNMYEYLGGKIEEGGVVDEELEEFKAKQKEELDEFLSHDDATMKDLREFMEAQRKDLEDFIDCGYEGDIDDEAYLKNLIKEAVREVVHEEIHSIRTRLEDAEEFLKSLVEEDK